MARAWTLALAVAMLMTGGAEAGFTKTGKITGNARKRLENGTVYTVAQDELSVKGSSGWSGLYLDANSTAVLYIPAGMTLKVTGGSASDRTGAGAGIEIPPSSTLIVTGGGTLEAYGGKGEDGDDGGPGGDGQVIDDDDDPNDEYGKAGKGGSGGAGGGGGGAGIGGNGGTGGASQTEPETSWVDTDGSYDYRGYNGYSGNGGGAGGSCGTLFLLGNVTVKASGGDGGSGGSQGVNGKFAVEHWTYSYRAGGGGGGGGGAGGIAGSNFGGGGGGGGAGGGGGSGGTYWTTQGKSDRNARGGNGEGGYNNGGGSRSTGGDSWGGNGNGGDGGYGGSVGSTGGAGTAYKTTTATAQGFSVDGMVDTHSAIEYTLTFDDGARLSTNMVAKFGYTVPTAPTTHRYGHTFQGWYTGEDGAGYKFYEADGSPVEGREIWTVAGDLTLYPQYERNTDDLSAVTLYINGTEVVDGTNKSGDGWSYNSRSGKISLTRKDQTYEIHGCDADGFAQIVAEKTCTVKITDRLEMSPGSRKNYIPFSVKSSSFSSSAEATLEVEEGAHCSLTGASGCPAIFVAHSDVFLGPDNTLVIKAKGALDVTGGEGAADIGLRAGDVIANCGKIYVETYDNWFSNIMPGHGTSDGNGFKNNRGNSARFYSLTGNEVYSVRMSFPGESAGDKTIYRQRVLGDVKDTVTPDNDGNIWLWVPKGDYEWGLKQGASYEAGDKIWSALVTQHTEATSFTPLNIQIDGEDIAHLNGPGWYTKYENSDANKVMLVITNAGPHVVTGQGNARINVQCSGQLTVTNVTLDASSWKTGDSRSAALHLDEGANLELTVQGNNSFSGPTSYPGIFVGYGSSLTIDGDGELIASGGSGASGIGGSWWNYDAQLCGDITINGGRITAIGGANGAGIGDAIRNTYISSWKSNGKITINGGVVTARGGQRAAGIGGGYSGAADVEITGGTVFATAGANASAIGVGVSPYKTSSNTFGLAAIYSAKDEVKPAAKNGAGKAVYPVSFGMEMPSCKVTSVIIEDEAKTCTDIWTDETGKLTLWLEPTNGEQYTIKITAVDADDNEKAKVWGYKMDDEGNTEFSTDMLVIDNTPIVGGKDASGTGWKYSATSTLLTISSGDHTITGSSTNGSINVVTTGSDIALTLDNLTLKTTYDRQSPFVISNNCTITLVGDNTIECIYRQNASGTSGTGSEYTAAVEVPKGASLVIDGEGTLVATAGFCGAGIGSRGARSSSAGSFDAGSITIKGGKIYATGGWGKTGGGAGIGGGNQGGVESVLVTGGYVHAIGGKNACGIGTGNNGPLLADSAFHVTGGTVMVEKGEGSFSDFTTALGSVISPTGSKAIVIDGVCSVHPKSFDGTTNPNPNPVNSDGEQLSFVLINGVGLEEGEGVTIIDDLWPEYGEAKVYADEDHAVCIWGVKTNAEHTIRVQSSSISGGETQFTVGAWTNSVQSVSGGTAPDWREIDGKTCYRVEVHALPAAKRMSVSGDVTNFVHSTMLSDYTGKIYLYLPEGEYDFKVGDYTYHALVTDTVTTATYKVGILVGGHDIGEETGEGWTYDGTAEKLTLLNQTNYLISGTNSERKVSVCVAHDGVGIESDRLVLNAASQGPFYLDGESATLEFKRGTISTAKVLARAIVSGGSLGMELPGAVARVVTDDGPVYTNAYRVTIGGLSRYGNIEIEDLEETGESYLAGYDTENIWADMYGRVYLYLPDGDYFFRVVDGAIVKAMVAIVDGGETTAIEFEETGITINGREAARLRGNGWINEDGLISLTDATTYVIAGTNSGATVTFAVEKSGAALSLDNLVMTNAEMSVAAFAFGNGDSKKKSIAVRMYGTNVVYGAEGLCAIEVDGTSTVTIGGDGILEVAGGSGKPAIGGDMGRLSITGGVVVATCGSGAAAIGAGQGEVSVAGGIVSAAGGIYVEEYKESGGTVVADDIYATTTVDGGSLHATNDVPAVVAKNTDGDTVYCVTVPTGKPDFDIGAEMPEWNGYSLKDVVSDELGNVYIWLPNGTYYFSIGEVPTRAVVNNGPATAEPWSVGVSVNGKDAAFLSGEGWTYDVTSHALAITNDNCTVSGTNTTGEVYLDFASDVAMAVSNLVLTATATEYAPINVASNVTVTVTLVGTNELASAENNLPAIHVPNTATLTLTNLNTIVSVPDLDHIWEYHTIITNIEETAEGVIETNFIDSVTYVTNMIDTVLIPALMATGAANAAAIGGGNDESYGTINIVGGEIYATGGNGGAGIGSGCFAVPNDSTEGAVNIFGGTVVATGGNYSAGIGGGNKHRGGAISISGGKVTAQGRINGAGIGGGYEVRGYSISIAGGEVVAIGGQYAAGIGGGTGATADEPIQVKISGGRVTATGGEGSAGIGSGIDDNRGATVSITSGTVVATGGYRPSGYVAPDDIGVGSVKDVYARRPSELTIKGASVHATHRTATEEYVAPAASNDTTRVWCVTVDVGVMNKNVEVAYLDGFAGTDEDSYIYTDDAGKVYLWLPNGTYIFYVGGLPFTATVDNGDTTAMTWYTGVTADGVDVSFAETKGRRWNYDYGTKTLNIVSGNALDSCVVSGTNTAGMVNIVAATTNELYFSISNLNLKADSASPIAITNGTVAVCLAGANTLDAQSTTYYAGLKVEQGATLILTNLEENAGIEAFGGDYAAGIGGNRQESAGTMEIWGGTIIANGGMDGGGAGIGGGFKGDTETIIIQGGSIIAYGGYNGGAGIGGGVKGNVGTININGGSIMARGGAQGGAGIGSGYYGRSGDINISGGRIQAYGGYDESIWETFCGAGIGGGDDSNSSNCSIAISGGTIFAGSGDCYDYGASKYAADIGNGYSGNDGYTVRITGGSIKPLSKAGREFNQSKTDFDYTYPADSNGHEVYKVTLAGFTPNAAAELVLPGYGANDIYADVSGEIYFWLANGTYQYAVGGRRFATKIEGETVTTVEIPDAYGVEIDGVDVAELYGEGWKYEVFAQKLSVTNACVISGTNTEGKVNISVDATGEMPITISNLYLKATSGSPIKIVAGTNTLCLAGTNILDAADAAGCPGLHVAGRYEGLVITNLYDGAKLVATGGSNAAGIGADNTDLAGNIEIRGGIVEATGGANGAGIGGGNNYGYVGVVIRGGTVRPVAGTGAAAIGYGATYGHIFGSAKIVFAGGSIVTDSASIHGGTSPANDDGTPVYRVELSGFEPNAKVELSIDGYGTYDIYADSAGNIYPWLWESDYIFMIGGVPYLATVTTSGAIAEPWLSGVTVDGTDVAYMGDGSGKWNYKASERILYVLSGSSLADCVTIAGTNTDSYVHIAATNGVYFKIADLCIATSNNAPIAVQSGDSTVAFAGTNTLDATQSTSQGYAGIQAGHSTYTPASLTLTNLEQNASIIAKGGAGAAGIGGRGAAGVNHVYIDIYGGRIEATGGLRGSGIGGGAEGNATVNIYGGEITATGGQYGTGIGGGSNASGRVNIMGGVVDAASGTYNGAGIGSGAESDANVYIYGGRVKARSNGTGAAIGGGNNSTGYVYISGGTVVAVPYTYATSKSIGSTRTGFGEVRFTGGSIDAELDRISPAPSDRSAAVFPVTVSSLDENIKVAFDGLPDDYGKNDIYSDDAGCVYLWLPENWETEHTIEPHPLLSASPRKLLGASAGTQHTFAANGYNYSVTINAEDGGAVAERGEKLELNSLRIDDFAVEDGYLLIAITASPATWLNGFVKTLKIRGSATLPIPDTDDANLDLTDAELDVVDAETATFVVPLGDKADCRFFRMVETQEEAQ